MAAAERAARVAGYDLMRVAAAFAVVAVHASATVLGWHDPAPEWLHWTNRFLATYAVPAFFFLSGVLVWGRPWRRGASCVGFLGRRASVVLVPYLAWSLAYWVDGPGHLPSSAGDLARQAATLGQLLVVGKTSGHLYFVPAVMLAYALTPLADAGLRRSAAALPLLAIGAMPYAHHIVGAAPAGLEPVARVVYTVVLHSPYIATGAWFARSGFARALTGRAWPALLAGGVVLMASGLLPPGGGWMLAARAATTACVLLGAVGGALAAGERWERLGGALRAPAALSYGVYLMHVLLLTRITGWLESLAALQAWNPLLAWIALLVLATGTSLALAALLDRSRYTRWAV